MNKVLIQHSQVVSASSCVSFPICVNDSLTHETPFIVGCCDLNRSSVLKFKQEHFLWWSLGTSLFTVRKIFSFLLFCWDLASSWLIICSTASLYARFSALFPGFVTFPRTRWFLKLFCWQCNLSTHCQNLPQMFPVSTEQQLLPGQWELEESAGVFSSWQISFR